MATRKSRSLFLEDVHDLLNKLCPICEEYEMDIYMGDGDERFHYTCMCCGDVTEEIERIINGMVK